MNFEFIEIRVRRFYSADEANVTTSSTVDVVPTDKGRDWKALIEGMAAHCASQIEGAPLANAREMTQPEAVEHREVVDTE